MRILLTTLVLLTLCCLTLPKNTSSSANRCFCQLYGDVDDCSCKVDTVDYFNNYKIQPRLSELLEKNFFRFYKVNLHRECPFWPDDSRCAMKDCSVHACTPDELPKGLKPENKYSKEAQQGECLTDEENRLGALDKSLSEESREAFKTWKIHDDDKFSFCEMDDEFSVDMEYVDLLLNPERYTGYKGASPRRIWNSIYNENCFKPDPDTQDYEALLTSKKVKDMCLEKRVFYRMISGLHASINIHLSAKYLLPDGWGGSKWGINIDEFQQRFDPENTDDEGPQWLKNLYFTYLVELRAITKVAPYLEKENLYTGDDDIDSEVKVLVSELLSTMKEFPTPFNENKMFQGDPYQASQLKEEFRNHFRNISRIMDCVGCDKCRLWGKLQTHGMGTALKILFSGDIYNKDTDEPTFSLHRTEIVALFNAFGRLSNSIKLLEEIQTIVNR